MKYKLTVTQTQKNDIVDQETGEVSGYNWFIQYTLIVPNRFTCASNYTADQTKLPPDPTMEEFEEMIAGTFGYPYPPEPI